MDNIIYERNYERKQDTETTLPIDILERISGPDGLLSVYDKKRRMIPRVISLEDKANYEYLLKRCDEFACDHYGRIYGEVDFQRYQSTIKLDLPMIEFVNPEDLTLLEDIAEKADRVSIEMMDDGLFRIFITIDYFEELASKEYEEYLLYESIMEDTELARMLGMPGLTDEELQMVERLNSILDRFDTETNSNRTDAFVTVLNQMGWGSEDFEMDWTRLERLLQELLDKTLGSEG